MPSSSHLPVSPRFVRFALCSVVLIAIVVSRVVYSNAVERGEQEAADHVVVQAPLIEQVPIMTSRLVSAQWSTSDGRVHTGALASAPTTRDGAFAPAEWRRLSGEWRRRYL